MSTRYCKCGTRYKDNNQSSCSKWLPIDGVIYQLVERHCSRCEHSLRIWIIYHSVPENDKVKVGQVIWLES